ncbi:sulfatase-like hydrolase/transferase [Runella sp. CRIBMP]|uniref:sulfatase family protein n=1 Tax=Runella sp. CRIBMP TaxID=2683261 RepID=UPI001412829D|nr:sulfatase [Runella sp. CRIBMP]NBB18552.1 sulfatase-like hydrolase/transferase [Runella sp. CRIBMP]
MFKKAFLFGLAATAGIFALTGFNPSKNTKSLAASPKNVIFILADDHRYDAMGFMEKFSGLQTPNLDKMAANGAHVQNAFVSTALCSPSRASILSGQYAHTHQVVDNFAPLPPNTKFFPMYLQKAGYKTAFLGKWHMGNADDAPQLGFDYWLSFKGQGQYYNPTFNINGKQVSHKDGYTTDLLTDYAIEWMGKQDKNKPFFLYLSHKAVHADFQPAKRHAGKYKDMPIQYPVSMYLTKSDTSKIWGKNAKDPETGEVKSNMKDMPNWVKNQRYSWHGVDYLYHGTISFNDFYRQYCETLLGVDESVGRVMKYLEDNGLAENTLVIYMGDNGFSFGERGLIDKRHAYEESMRVPMLVSCPSVIKPKTKLTNVIQNIDIAPTILAYAGLATPAQMQGKSFLPLLKGQKAEWKDRAFYEYYWEYDYPQTPTMFAVRTDRYKYIFNHGVWDANELYDLQTDPEEINNLIRSPQHQSIAKDLRDQVWGWLESTNGLQIPLKPIKQKRSDHIYKGNY